MGIGLGELSRQVEKVAVTGSPVSKGVKVEGWDKSVKMS